MDYSTYDQAFVLFDVMGFGKPPDTRVPMDEPAIGALSFKAPLMLVAEGLGATIEDYVWERQVATTDKPIEVKAGRVEAGTVSAVRFAYTAIIEGRRALTVEHITRLGPDQAPHWPNGRGWKVTVEGLPSMVLESRIAINDEDDTDQACLGTAMHSVHAMAPVCAAAPGIRTFLDLPTIVGRRGAVEGNGPLTYRVVQWTTGNVGKKSVHAIAANSTLQLVGCYAWSPDKVGRDVGELCGIETLGVLATEDIDALLALKPDCVVYNPMFAKVDELVRILGAGINVVTTSEFITGHQLGEERDRITEACERGGSTIFGSGINPGFIQLFAIVTAGISDRVDRISIAESFDTTIYNSPATEIPMGFGYPIDRPDLREITEKGSGIFREAVLLVADALGTELDDIRCDVEYAQTTEDLELPGRLDHRGGLRRGHRCPLEGDSRWSRRHRDPWSVDQGSIAGPRLVDRFRLHHHG